MDKRNFVFFLIMSMGVLVLSSVLFPPPKPPLPQADAPADAAQDDAAKKADEAVAPPVAGEQPAEQAPADDKAVAELDVPVAPEVPLQYLTLGSLDRETGFRMLVTLTNRGAAVHRAELSSPRFRDLHDRSGYLGHLALENTEGGVKVGLAGLGTPAADAGIAVGDVIVSLQRPNADAIDTKTVDGFAAELAKTRSGQEVTLRALRAGATQSFTVKLTRRPLEVMRPEIENIRMRNGTVPDGFIDPPSFLTTLSSAGGQQLDEREAAQLATWLEAGNWAVTSHDETSATFERPLPTQSLVLIKRYTLEPVPAGSRDNENYPGYNVKLDVEVRNTGDAPQSVAYRLDGPTGLPIEGWWYTHKISREWFSTAGLRDVVVRFQGNPTQQIDCSTIAKDKAEPMGQDQSLAFVGVDAVYFSAVLIPVKASLDDDWFDFAEAVRVGPRLDERTPITYTNVSCRLTRDPVELAPGASQKDSYQIFIGPKRPELLAQYQAANDPNYSLKDIIYYGMWPFGAVARGMLSVLHFFYGIVGNFGIAIIMLTVAVRGAMFPISFKQTQNMARMQSLKPELDIINEKYKTDMQKRSAAMQDLYRKHKINPLGGCLPVLLQLPVFMGLYRSIMIDVELRQSPLFGHMIRWCSDLSAPDMLYDWSWFMPRFVTDGIGIFGLGPYFNILPLVTVVLFLVSMKMSMPEPTNEQAVMQQKMMKYMTGFMGLLFYKVASGLCLYFIASSLWGLGERRLLNKSKAKDEANATTSAPPARSSTNRGNGQNGSAGKRARKPSGSGNVSYDVDDTIAAIGTAQGGAARGMVRLSGPATLDIVARCFAADASNYAVADLSHPTACTGSLEVRLDNSDPHQLPCELLLWPTDRSYTRQPVAEFHTFGSPPLLQAILDSVCRAGARLAEPGEFTLRAFLAGRLDLTQAEAVLGVIDARHTEQLDIALRQLAGGLAGPLHRLREELVDILAELEAGLDFVEEDILFISAEELTARLERIASQIKAIADQMATRLASPASYQVVLTGPPNVGKSSLFNALAMRFGVPDHRIASAIVSNEPGTTRDYLLTEIDLGGIRCELIDTAGLEDDPLGEIATASQTFAKDRRRQAVVRAYCVDAANSADCEVPPAELVVVTKFDLAPQFNDQSIGVWNDPPTVVTSSVTGVGIDQLQQVLSRLLSGNMAATSTSCIAATADRCRDSLRLAEEAVSRSIGIATSRGGDELVAVELRFSLAELGKVVGTVYTDDILDRIFKTFCIGK